MDDRQFDALSRRVAALAVPRLPRRGLMSLLGGATLAGALGVALDAQPAEAAKCKKEGQKCDKKKCKQKNKKCCCEGKCKKDRCKGGSGGSCPIDARFNDEWGTSGGDDGEFLMPWGIATDPDGNVFVTDSANERIQAFTANGAFRGEIGSDGNGTEQFRDPRGIAFNQNSNGDVLFVSDPIQPDNDRRFRQFTVDTDGNPFEFDFEADEGEANLNDPHGVAIDSEDRIWVVNQSTPGRIFLFNRNGVAIDNFAPAFSSPGDDFLEEPEGIAVWEDDNGDFFVYVADTANNRIVKFEYVNDDLEYRDEEGSTGGGDDQFNRPTGLAVDACGNLYIADRFNDRVQVFDRNLNPENTITRSFDEPTGVALGPDGDVLYVVDSDNNRIVKFDLQ